ncbi:MAG: type II secretion system protein GspD [Candidatus Eisenbacteria bacterium]|uniref:Type II secretion system protein GspD n=1 Tax=Eiseniibacteriota bacterium TaxID=2212470 RepID=A0A7Y2EAZ9_UNCEI|nr:type II secretion system protein GspD [Candidatus Eisenbacteria bacterium]
MVLLLACLVSTPAHANTVTLNVSGVPLDEVVRLVADQAGLTLSGTTLPNLPVTLRLTDTEANEALRLIFLGTPYDGWVRNGHLSVFGEDDELLRTFPLAHAAASELSMVLSESFEDANVSPDPRTNALVVRGNSAVMRSVEELLPTLDRRMPQILLKADIVEVSDQDQLEIGFDWEFAYDDEDGSVTHQGSATGNPIASVTDFVFSYARFGKHDISALLGVLNQVVETRVLSSPRVVTTPGRTANILVGERVPYPRATTETQTGATLQEIEFVDVGVQLEVTPRVSADGVITMVVHPEVSQVLDDAVGGIPVIGTREATAEVSVLSGETVILGGLKRKNRDTTVSKLPILGDIPLLGGLFRWSSTNEREAELMIFLTPSLVDGPLVQQSLELRDRLERELEVPKDW